MLVPLCTTFMAKPSKVLMLNLAPRFLTSQTHVAEFYAKPQTNGIVRSLLQIQCLLCAFKVGFLLFPATDVDRFRK